MKDPRNSTICPIYYCNPVRPSSVIGSRQMFENFSLNRFLFETWVPFTLWSARVYKVRTILPMSSRGGFMSKQIDVFHILFAWHDVDMAGSEQGMILLSDKKNSLNLVSGAERIPFPRCCCRAVCRSTFQTPCLYSTKDGGVTAVYQQFSLRVFDVLPIHFRLLVTAS